MEGRGEGVFERERCRVEGGWDVGVLLLGGSVVECIVDWGCEYGWG